MFLVPHDTPGFHSGKVFNKSGRRFYQNGEMIFENARVPHANVVSEVNCAVKKSGGAGCAMDAHADKLVRDAFIWNHLAGDIVQRLKVAGRLRG